MEIIRDIKTMQELAQSWRQQRRATVLVPTMGYFHAGHLSLMAYGRSVGDPLVVSLFVNPTQFGPNEDLDRYPRDWERDCRLAQEQGVDYLFAPPVEELYPAGYQTYVTVEGVTQGLCGAGRPGHFRGVATIVTKLFNLVQPAKAIFGEKDYQQLVTIQRLVQDLHIPTQVIGRPIVREADGLAMSSRNVYLNPAERDMARGLSQALAAAQRLAAAGERSSSRLLAAAQERLAAGAGLRVEYLQLVDPQSLAEVPQLHGTARLAAAVRVGQTRLIDNVLLEEAAECSA